MLGVLYATLGAFTFALNNVAMRRGVVTGSVLQGMAMTVPIGGLSFLVMTVAFGELGQLVVFPAVALAWLAGQGIVHFVLGRYCNYKSNQLMGVNLAAPVVQLQVPFAMMLAVATLHEKFTMLQVIGSVLMLGGSFVTQTKTGKGIKKTSAELLAATPTGTVTSQQKRAMPRPAFRPRVSSGLCFGADPADAAGPKSNAREPAFAFNTGLARFRWIHCGAQMHDPLARQPRERHRREHHELTQLAKGDGHDQEGKATRSARPWPCLAARYPSLPPAHRHIVEGKGKRAEGGVKNTEQERFLPPGLDADPIIGQLAAPPWNRGIVVNLSRGGILLPSVARRFGAEKFLARL